MLRMKRMVYSASFQSFLVKTVSIGESTSRHNGKRRLHGIRGRQGRQEQQEEDPESVLDKKARMNNLSRPRVSRMREGDGCNGRSENEGMSSQTITEEREAATSPA